MKKLFLITIVLFIGFSLNAQQADSISNYTMNSAEQMLAKDSRLTIGGYGEVHYNQPFNSNQQMNGTLDVHRIVMLMGYKFNDRTQFVTEIEYEHVSELYVEQAFLQYKINSFLNFRGGLMLIPMGIINEYHEPTTFNGVERPLVDNKIAPTTWREIGLGFTGNILPASLRYQAYVVNGFNGYNGSGKLNGKDGLRGGRQKGAESYISSPNFSAKVEYYGIRGLNLGLSGYLGKTQSTLYHKLDKDDSEALAKADSSVVGISMIGFDARYSISGLQLRGQLYYNSLSNTEQYNAFTAAADGSLNNLGSSMIGYYVEAGYNVFSPIKKIKTELIPFVRVEKSNTHNDVADNITKNTAYNINVITTGLTWKMVKNAVLKIDFQFYKPESSDKFDKVFNAGFGVMF